MAVVPVLGKLSLMGMWIVFLLVLWLSVEAAAERFPRPPSPPPSPPPRRMVKCRSPQFTRCFLVREFCPPQCPTSCLMDCVTCKPLCNCNVPGAVCEDPRFVGGDGITFYFHGRKDQDFCLVSDTNLHINAHFIGKRNPNLTRDFTWVQSIGIIFNTHKLLIAAKKTSTWDDKIDRLALFFNDIPISLPANEGAKWQSQVAPLVSVTRTSNTNGVTVEVAGNFRVTAAVVPITGEDSRVHGYNITEEDCFAHLEVGFKFYKLSDMVDGVLGQTYRKNYVSKVKVEAPMPVLGGLGKFSSSHIFATDCKASRFGRGGLAEGSVEYASLQCKSGMKGTGVVCKK